MLTVEPRWPADAVDLEILIVTGDLHLDHNGTWQFLVGSWEYELEDWLRDHLEHVQRQWAWERYKLVAPLVALLVEDRVAHLWDVCYAGQLLCRPQFRPPVPDDDQDDDQDDG